MLSELVVIKRDGNKTPYDRQRVQDAIWSAAQAVGGSDINVAIDLSYKVEAYLRRSYFTLDLAPSVEQVQDAVEKMLIEEGHAKTAKAYILYRNRHGEMRDVQSSMLNVVNTLDSYIGDDDSFSVNENANSGYSFGGALMHASGEIIKKYVAEKMYPAHMIQHHNDGDFHIHDLNFGIAGYCAGWSLKDLLFEGFNGVPGKVSSKPAKHFDTILMQIVNFFGTLQNEWAGAQAFSSFDTYLAPYVRMDKLSYNDVKQKIQMFVFNLNVASRWGGQTPFTNLTFDMVVPADLKDLPAIYAGDILSETYADFQPEMDMINKAFMEVMITGDGEGNMFSFPIPTYNLTKDFNWDSELADLLFDMTAKFGIPNFQNFVNSDLDPSDVRSMCCRLQLDLRELKNKTGGAFGAGEKTGSIGVVTINLPRIGYTADSERSFFSRLAYLMDVASESLELKRKVVSHNFEKGLFPYSRRYLPSLDHHFATIGLVGLNEACENLLGKNIASVEGKEFALRVLNFMRQRVAEYQAITGHIYNLEATPAEGTTYRLAKLDTTRYPGIFTQGDDEPYYTNSSHLPVSYTDDLFEVLEHQDEIQSVYNGGTMLHVFIGEHTPDRDATRALVKKIVTNYHIPNFTITPEFSVCEDHGYIASRTESCPHCGKETTIYSRVTGYYRPVNAWNKGKRAEFKDRRVYDVFAHSVV